MSGPSVPRGQDNAGQAVLMRPPQDPGPLHETTPGQAPRQDQDQDQDHAGPLAELPVEEQAEVLYEETEQLKEALERRPIIDVARGVLMASWSCTGKRRGRSWFGSPRIPTPSCTTWRRPWWRPRSRCRCRPASRRSGRRRARSGGGSARRLSRMSATGAVPPRTRRAASAVRFVLIFLS